MNKRLAAVIFVILLTVSTAFARNVSQITGNNYLTMSKQNRVQAVTSLINDAKKGGVTIKQTPISYCTKLDRFYAKHPDMKSQTLAVVLKTLIVMEYDWGQAGVNKDQLARQWLGDKLYQENKTRLSKR